MYNCRASNQKSCWVERKTSPMHAVVNLCYVPAYVGHYYFLYIPAAHQVLGYLKIHVRSLYKG